MHGEMLFTSVACMYGISLCVRCLDYTELAKLANFHSKRLTHGQLHNINGIVNQPLLRDKQVALIGGQTGCPY